MELFKCTYKLNYASFSLTALNLMLLFLIAVSITLQTLCNVINFVLKLMFFPPDTTVITAVIKQIPASSVANIPHLHPDDITTL